MEMKRILRRFREKLTLRLNDSPPPYRESENCDDPTINGDAEDTETILPCDTLDLLINCSATKVSEESEASYEEIEMGLWHSTPLSHRHKSKISLTWILKENLETKMTDKRNIERKPEKERIGLDRRKDFEPHKQYNKRSDRIVGRNEFYHNLRLRNACEEFVSQETCSDTSVGTEYTRRKHKHRHRRKKKSKFGYDIRDLDSFLSEASIDRPGNIPVVVAYPTPLYQTQATRQKELPLALGTVINAVFKSRQWLYAQTPHGHEGYVLYSACLPLGILPCRTSQKKTPCWESSTDIYRRPSGNFTDTEKEQMHVRTRSESRYRTRNRANCAEKDFDTLYLKTKSVCSDLNKLGKENRLTTFNLYKVKDSNNTRRHTLLVVKRDYWGSVINNTVTVSKGEVVVLVQERGTSDDPEWFYVRKKDGSHGYLPASVAGHGYI